MTTHHTIAVVDDDRALREALARLLSTLGYRAVTFPSAVEFLTAAATNEATCLIVDIHLGGTSGLDLVRLLPAAGFRFPVIFMTGSDDDTIRTQCMALGCVAFLRKPISEDRLVDAIQKAIGSPSRIPMIDRRYPCAPKLGANVVRSRTDAEAAK